MFGLFESFLKEYMVKYGLGYLGDEWGSIPGWDREGIFSIHHRLQTGSGTHPVSFTMGSGAGVKATGE
jgi:hypothetical protein